MNLRSLKINKMKKKSHQLAHGTIDQVKQRINFYAKSF